MSRTHDSDDYDLSELELDPESELDLKRLRTHFFAELESASVCDDGLDSSDGVLEAILDQVNRADERAITPLGVDDLFSAAHADWNCEDVLARLFPYAISHGLTNLRYYRVVQDGTGKKLVSTESAGHVASVAADFRAGGIVKYRDAAPLHHSDSFWCFSSRSPVVFTVDPNATQVFVTDRQDIGISVARVRDDSCRTLLTEPSKRVWVDFPVIVQGKWVAKFSADLDGLPSDREQVEKIIAFWRVLELIAPGLDLRVRSGLEELQCAIQKDVSSEDSVELLMKYCVSILKDRLQADEASVYVPQRDSLAREQLVLRATSSVFDERQVNTACCKYGDDSRLADWVASNGRSVRILDAGSERERDALLAGFSAAFPPEVSRSLGEKAGMSVLAVPFAYMGMNGVLEFTRSADCPSRGFSEREQRVAEFAAQRCIRQRLEVLESSARSRNLAVCREAINSVQLRPFDGWLEDPVAPAKAIESMFSSGLKGKLVGINRLSADKKTYHHQSVGGDLAKLPTTAFDLAGTLASRAIRPESRYVFISDIPHAIRSGCFRKIACDPRSAIAMKVQYASTVFGAMTILSDRYDISPEIHVPALELISDHVALAFARQEITRFSSKLAGAWAKLHQAQQLLDAKLRDHCGYMYDELFLADTYSDNGDRGAHGSEEINVRGAIHQAAVVAGLTTGNPRDIDYLIPTDWRIPVSEPALLAIIFNLLKQSWDARKDGGPVVVSAKLVGCRLEVKLTGVTCGMTFSNAKRAIRAVKEGHVEGEDSIGTQPGLGLAYARDLASREEYGGVCGDVRLTTNGDGEDCAVLVQLPLRERGGYRKGGETYDVSA